MEGQWETLRKAATSLLSNQRSFLPAITAVAAASIVTYASYTFLAPPSNKSNKKSVIADRSHSWFGLLRGQGVNQAEVNKDIDNYTSNFKGARQVVGECSTVSSINERKKHYAPMINTFYDLVTDFYEYGWGQSFHFAPRWKNENFQASLARVEHFIAARLNLKPGDRCMDLGCGVGGPARSIALFSKCKKVYAINNCQYQIDVGQRETEELGLKDQVEHVKGDFMKLDQIPQLAELCDGAYEFEATCHAPSRTKCFQGVFDKLKPGARFAGLEWVMTDKYNPKNVDHVRIKEGIEVGNALPTLTGWQDVIQALESAGFNVIEHYDLNETMHTNSNEIPWYEPLQGSLTTLSGFRMSSVGRMCTNVLVGTLETIGVAPKGSTKVSQVLSATADDLVEGGVHEVFTPSYYFLAEKPTQAKRVMAA